MWLNVVLIKTNKLLCVWGHLGSKSEVCKWNHVKNANFHVPHNCDGRHLCDGPTVTTTIKKRQYISNDERQTCDGLTVNAPWRSHYPLIVIDDGRVREESDRCVTTISPVTGWPLAPRLTDYGSLTQFFEWIMLLMVTQCFFWCCWWYLVIITQKLYNLNIMLSYDKSFELWRDVWFREEPLLWPCIGDIYV